MKTEIIKSETKPKIKFPCLMIYEEDDMVILVVSKIGNGYSGTLIHAGNNKNFANCVGEMRTRNDGGDWSPNGLIPFHGTLQLTTD